MLIKINRSRTLAVSAKKSSYEDGTFKCDPSLSDAKDDGNDNKEPTNTIVGHHVTSSENASKIMTEGFKLHPHKFGTGEKKHYGFGSRWGEGIYFSLDKPDEHYSAQTDEPVSLETEINVKKTIPVRRHKI